MVLGGVLWIIASVEIDYRDNCVCYFRLAFTQSCCAIIIIIVTAYDYQNLNVTNIQNASIPEQVNVSQAVKDITSTPENLTAADVSTSAAIVSQLTNGATMNATVS